MTLQIHSLYIFLHLILDLWIYVFDDNTTNLNLKTTLASLLIETNSLKTVHFGVQSSTGKNLMFSFRHYHEQKRQSYKQTRHPRIALNTKTTCNGRLAISDQVEMRGWLFWRSQVSLNWFSELCRKSFELLSEVFWIESELHLS